MSAMTFEFPTANGAQLFANRYEDVCEQPFATVVSFDDVPDALVDEVRADARELMGREVES